MTAAELITRPASNTTAVPTGSLLKLAISSEWVKLKSVRSTMWSLAATVGFTVGLGMLFSYAFLHRDANDARDVLRFDPTSRALQGVFLAQLAVGVLGVLTMSSEHSTGMIRSSIAAVPQRRVLLTAKAIVLGTVTLVIGMSASFLAFFAGQAILATQHFGVSINDPGVLRAVLGAGTYLTMIALFGLAIGTIVRRTPGAISALFAIVLIFPLLAEAFPAPWNIRIGRLLPLNAGQAMFTVRVEPDLLTPRGGLVVFSVWLVGAYILATGLLTKRDV